MKKQSYSLSIVAFAISASLAHAENSIDLGTITVTGNAVPTTVTHQQLNQRIAQDLKQAMKEQVGMAISGGNGVAQYYSIRSLGEDKINLEVDGTTSSSSVLHHQGRFMLDPSLAKVIDVEKGTGSASAGIGALAGVVRVTTVDAKDLLDENQAVGFKVGTTASSNRGIGSNLAVYANHQGVDALFAGNLLNNDNYKDAKGKKNYGSKLNQNSYLAKVGYDFNENHQIRFSLRQEYQKGRRTARIEFPYSYDEDKTEATGESNSAQRQRTANVEYNGKNLGFISTINANLFRTQTDDYKPPKESGRGITNTSSEMEVTKNLSAGANLNLSSSIGKHELKYGLNYRTETAKPSTKNWYKAATKYNIAYANDEKKHEYGAYLEGVWDLDPVTVITGVRYDGFKYLANSGQQAKNAQVNPSVSAIYSVTPDFILTAAFAQASRAPRLNETLLINENFTGVTVDNKLKPETARRGEFGFKWQYEGFKLSANVFQQNITDVIIYHKGGENKEKTAYNVGNIYNNGKIKMHGYEVDASYQNGGFKTRVAVSQSKPRGYGDAFKHVLAENPYYFWSIGRQWLTSLSYRFDAPSLELGWTGRYFEKVNYFGGKPGAVGKKAGSGVHDLFVNWQPLKTDKLNVNLGVNNVLNKYYLSHSQRGNTGFYERGREFVAGVNYRF